MCRNVRWGIGRKLEKIWCEGDGATIKILMKIFNH